MKDNLVTLRFILRKNKSVNGIAPIRLLFKLNGKKSELSTSIRCKVSLWDKYSERPRGSSLYAKTICHELDQFKLQFLRHCNQLQQRSQDITVELIKETINQKEERLTILFAIQKYIDSLEDLVNIETSPATVRKYKCLKRKIIAFLKHEFKYSDMELRSIRFPFVLKFEKFLKTKHRIGHNTTVKYIQFLNATLRNAVKQQWLSSFPFEGYKCSFQQRTRESLTQDQIDTLVNKKFDKRHLEEVRDVFIFCCYTGLAHVDVYNLSPDNIVLGIDGKKWIHTKRQKTNTVTQVPLLAPAIFILKKYKDNVACLAKERVLPVRTNQKMNLSLKSIATACDITIPLSMHIARHTFATTILLNNNVPIVTVSKLLGHKKLATTQIYAKLKQKKISNDMEMLSQKLFPTTNDSLSNATS